MAHWRPFTATRWINEDALAMIDDNGTTITVTTIWGAQIVVPVTLQAAFRTAIGYNPTPVTAAPVAVVGGAPDTSGGSNGHA